MTVIKELSLGIAPFFKVMDASNAGIDYSMKEDNNRKA